MRIICLFCSFERNILQRIKLTEKGTMLVLCIFSSYMDWHINRNCESMPDPNLIPVLGIHSHELFIHPSRRTEGVPFRSLLTLSHERV